MLKNCGATRLGSVLLHSSRECEITFYNLWHKRLALHSADRMLHLSTCIMLSRAYHNLSLLSLGLYYLANRLFEP